MFHKLLLPGNLDSFIVRWGILAMLAFSMIALLTAPVLMPEGYSWITHTTSESAAQGLQGAWLARTGFILLGFAVLWLVAAAYSTWARGASWMHLTFGIMMIGTAVYAHRPFMPDIPYDVIEDWLHSFTATLMRFAFSLGVFFRLLQRARENLKIRVLDLVALASAIFIPLLMISFPGITGLVQRLMFLVAYLWYGTEAWQLAKRFVTA